MNISIINDGYKKIVDIINKAIVAEKHGNNPEKIKDVLKEMTMCAHNHFLTEEVHMVEFGCSEFQHHKEEHHSFTIRTIAYLDRVINGDYQIAGEITEYLKQWLANHIQGTDKRYAECFNKNGISV